MMAETNHDLLVISKFRNLRLQEWVDKYGTAQALADAAGVLPSLLGQLLNLKRVPWKGPSGRLPTDQGKCEPTSTALRLCELTGEMFEDLFPATLYAVTLPEEVRRTFNSTKIMSLQEAAEQRLLPERTDPEGEALVHAREMKEEMVRVLRTLSPREEIVLRMRFGIGDDAEPMTLEAIGASWGLNKERIRQIENNALRKLRHPSCAKHLRAFLESHGTTKDLKL